MTGILSTGSERTVANLVVECLEKECVRHVFQSAKDCEEQRISARHGKSNFDQITATGAAELSKVLQEVTKAVVGI